MPKPELPLGLRESDLSYPKKGRVIEHLTLYRTERLGWCVATLKIGSSRRGPERTYGARLSDGQAVRMGGGPHVLEVKTVYVTEERKAALAQLLEIYQKGMADAGTIRDRIGSRRAEGQLRRARGETYWRWSN